MPILANYKQPVWCAYNIHCVFVTYIASSTGLWREERRAATDCSRMRIFSRKMSPKTCHNIVGIAPKPMHHALILHTFSGLGGHACPWVPLTGDTLHAPYFPPFQNPVWHPAVPAWLATLTRPHAQELWGGAYNTAPMDWYQNRTLRDQLYHQCVVCYNYCVLL